MKIIKTLKYTNNNIDTKTIVSIQKILISIQKILISQKKKQTKKTANKKIRIKKAYKQENNYLKKNK